MRVGVYGNKFDSIGGVIQEPRTKLEQINHLWW